MRGSGALSRTATATATEQRSAPWGWKWRSSAWYITSVSSLAVATDGLTYTVVIPVLPYRLQEQGYSDVSSHTSWLLFSYSMGIGLGALPIAYTFHRLPHRQSPMVVAVIVLIGSLILFMLVNPFPSMVVSRFLQGAASSVCWTVGFALICENVPQKNIGRQIGFAMAGMSIGTTIAPPIGGALYQRYGWHAPFIFCIALCVVDLIARLLIVEQRHLHKYGIEAAVFVPNAQSRVNPGPDRVEMEGKDSPRGDDNVDPQLSEIPTVKSKADEPMPQPGPRPLDAERGSRPVKELSILGVLRAIGTSRRGMSGLVMTVVWGGTIGLLEPTLTLRVQDIWQKNSAFVGLIYLAAAAPTFFAGPIFGHLADKYGSEWIMAPLAVLALPFLPLMLRTQSLAGFIVFFAIVNTLLAAASAPNGLELTMAAQETEGISEIYQFAAMNLSFALSTAVGAVIGGQMYDHLPQGWTAVIWFTFGLIAVTTPIFAVTAGRVTLLNHGLSLFRRKRRQADDSIP